MKHYYTPFGVYEGNKIMKSYGFEGIYDIFDRDNFMMQLELDMPYETYVMHKLDGSLQACIEQMKLYLPAAWKIKVTIKGDNE